MHLKAPKDNETIVNDIYVNYENFNELNNFV